MDYQITMIITQICCSEVQREYLEQTDHILNLALFKISILQIKSYLGNYLDFPGQYCRC